MTTRTILKDLKRLNIDAIALFHHLDLFQELNDIINKNEELKKADSTLLTWMRIAFTNDLVIGIGRICDKHRKTRSLVRFLENLKVSPSLLTRKRYVQLFRSKMDKEFARKRFDKIAGRGKSSYSISRINKDIRKLTKQGACYQIICYRDQYIAHNDRNRKRSVPTYSQLFEAFKVIESMVKKYNSLIRATTMNNLRPTDQGDWQEPLRIPWIK